jgi:hypothetical protein
MPSVAHEAPIELIRQCPPLALELVQAMAVNDRDQAEPLPEQVEVSLGPTDLTDVVPAQYLADAVVVVSDAATGAAVMAIVIEPQGRDDPTKEFSWPVYLTAVRRATACRRAYLLVVCPNPTEAEKCRQVIRIGQPGFNLAPTVIDPLNTPGTGDASPYLTIFASCMGAINMEEDQGARHILAAIRDTGASAADRERLTTIILTLASDAARQLLVGLAVQRGPAPYRHGPFPDGLPPNPACIFRCTGLSSDSCRVRDGVCVDPFVAVGADDKCLAPLYRH